MTKKLFIIEDEPDMIHVLKQRAKYHKFEYYIDTTGAGWMEEMLKVKPDVILLDMNLPRMSGFGILRELRSTQELSHIPIIILSAISHKEVIDEALALGAKAYFSKEGNLDTLFEIINGYVETPGKYSTAMH